MYASYVSSPLPRPWAAVHGSDDRFAVHRIYCVGRNYADHVREMGGDPSRETPLFFTKPADAVVANGTDVPYPPRTTNFHHEVELVVAIGKGGANITVDDALSHVYGYAVGNDLTRRDLQAEARVAVRDEVLDVRERARRNIECSVGLQAQPPDLATEVRRSRDHGCRLRVVEELHGLDRLAAADQRARVGQQVLWLANREERVTGREGDGQYHERQEE
jgi:hypothetical protein